MLNSILRFKFKILILFAVSLSLIAVLGSLFQFHKRITEYRETNDETYKNLLATTTSPLKDEFMGSPKLVWPSRVIIPSLISTNSTTTTTVATPTTVIPKTAETATLTTTATTKGTTTIPRKRQAKPPTTKPTRDPTITNSTTTTESAATKTTTTNIERHEAGLNETIESSETEENEHEEAMVQESMLTLETTNPVAEIPSSESLANQERIRLERLQNLKSLVTQSRGRTRSSSSSASDASANIKLPPTTAVKNTTKTSPNTETATTTSITTTNLRNNKNLSHSDRIKAYRERKQQQRLQLFGTIPATVTKKPEVEEAVAPKQETATRKIQPIRARPRQRATKPTTTTTNTESTLTSTTATTIATTTTTSATTTTTTSTITTTALPSTKIITLSSEENEDDNEVFASTTPRVQVIQRSENLTQEIQMQPETPTLLPQNGVIGNELDSESLEQSTQAHLEAESEEEGKVEAEAPSSSHISNHRTNTTTEEFSPTLEVTATRQDFQETETETTERNLDDSSEVEEFTTEAVPELIREVILNVSMVIIMETGDSENLTIDKINEQNEPEMKKSDESSEFELTTTTMKTVPTPAQMVHQNLTTNLTDDDYYSDYEYEYDEVTELTTKNVSTLKPSTTTTTEPTTTPTTTTATTTTPTTTTPTTTTATTTTETTTTPTTTTPTTTTPTTEPTTTTQTTTTPTTMKTITTSTEKINTTESEVEYYDDYEYTHEKYNGTDTGADNSIEYYEDYETVTTNITTTLTSSTTTSSTTTPSTTTTSTTTASTTTTSTTTTPSTSTVTENEDETKFDEMLVPNSNNKEILIEAKPEHFSSYHYAYAYAPAQVYP